MVKSVAVDTNANNLLSEIVQLPPKLKQAELEGTGAESSIEASAERVYPPKSESIQENIAKEKSSEEASEELEEAFETISDFMNLYNRNINFSLDERSDKTIIKVFDSDTKELVKQFPSEDLIELAHKIYELRQDIDLKSGIFLDEKV